MKFSLLCLLALTVVVLPCCTTETTTHADGSVTVTKRIDSQALIAGGSVVQKTVPIFYSPRQPVPMTSGKEALVVEPEPAKEPTWMELGLSLLGL